MTTRETSSQAKPQNLLNDDVARGVLRRTGGEEEAKMGDGRRRVYNKERKLRSVDGGKTDKR